MCNQPDGGLGVSSDVQLLWDSEQQNKLPVPIGSVSGSGCGFYSAGFLLGGSEQQNNQPRSEPMNREVELLYPSVYSAGVHIRAIRTEE